MEQGHGNIWVATVENAEDLGREQMFDSAKHLTVKAHQVMTEHLCESLAATVDKLGHIVLRLPDKPGGFAIETITFALTVSDTGKVSLIGELAAGLSSAITITLRKRHDERAGQSDK